MATGLKDASMNRRDFLRMAGTGLALSAMGCETISAQKKSDRRPNIVLILADDLGYAGVGCQGCRDIATPNIDSIAAGGVRFTDAYVTCPVCSPTRAGLMTGRYQQRFGHEFNPGPAQNNPDFGLRSSEVTLAERLQSAGYKTGMVGKWHLGSGDSAPTSRGFEDFFGFYGGAHSYLDPTVDTINAIRRGTEPVDEKDYLTDAFTREAIAYIRNRKADPFFLYVAYNAVHTPMHVSPPRLKRAESIADPNRKIHATMLMALDDGVGAILQTLRETGLEDNTLVIFLTDNGGPTPSNTSQNTPLSGFKGQVLEGGIRVPYMMRWKGRIPGGQVYGEPVISLDLSATILTVAGVRDGWEKDLEGVYLLDYLKDKKGQPHEALYWRFGAQSAIRMGEWKLLKQGGTSWRLYNLRLDIAESTDLANQEPQKAAELLEAFQKWDARNIAPRWTQANRPKQVKAAGKPRPQKKKAVKTGA